MKIDGFDRARGLQLLQAHGWQILCLQKFSVVVGAVMVSEIISYMLAKYGTCLGNFKSWPAGKAGLMKRYLD